VKIALSVAGMNVGGIATFVLNLSQFLGQAGHEVVVIAQRAGEWWPRLAEIGVQGYCLPHWRWDSVQHAARRFATYLAAQRVDLLLINIGIDNRLPMLALHLLPDALPVVLVLHNDRPEVYDLAATNRGAWNCAVGVSPKVQENARTRLGQKRILLISHGIPLPTGDQLRERLHWLTPLRLLFVGRLDRQQKGIFRLPAIIAACHRQQFPVHLTVIGDGADRAPFLESLREAGVTDLVDVHGFQPHAAVLAQMRENHLLLLPSNFEGLGLVLQEAQANGCVPVASALNGCTDTIIADGVNGRLVAPTDTIGFVAAIHTFLDAGRWRQCSQAGITHARQHYSIGHMGEQYVALFDALVRGADALPVARSTLRKQGATPFTRWDDLPQPLRTRLWPSYRSLRRHFPRHSNG
jgi:glycosyltransferase involved in cell wall biosynthesis